MRIINLTDKVFELHKNHIIREIRILKDYTIVALEEVPHELHRALVFIPQEATGELTFLASSAIVDLGGDKVEKYEKVGEDDVFDHYVFELPHH